MAVVSSFSCTFSVRSLPYRDPSNCWGTWGSVGHHIYPLFNKTRLNIIRETENVLNSCSQYLFGHPKLLFKIYNQNLYHWISFILIIFVQFRVFFGWRWEFPICSQGSQMLFLVILSQWTVYFECLFHNFNVFMDLVEGMEEGERRS